MPQSFGCLHVHIIFSTKDRVAAITPELKPQLYEYCGGILRAEKNCLVAAGGTADHVHFLVSLSREASIAKTVQLVKSNSSGWVHKTFRQQHAFAWQAGYGAFAVSFSHLGTVKKYIANQETHHRTASFQDEFHAFLNRHQISFDERYVWD